MNTPRLLCLLPLAAVGAVACGSSDTKSSDEPGPGAGSLTLAVACTDSIEDVYAPQTGLPEYDASRRGDVVRCAADRTLSKEEIDAVLRVDEFADIDVKSAVRVYRIAYRTERLLGHEGLTTALLFLPDRPIAGKAPVIVAAHGFNGQADDCRFSTQFALAGEPWRVGLNTMGMMLALSSHGYPVVAPDYPGFGDGSSTVFSSEDEAHSVLDGTRALHAVLAPGATSDQVVLVGHSQGGHAVLSAQALAPSYGLEGRLVAVVPIAPEWVVARAWGAVISKLARFTTADNAPLIGLAMTYFNSHADLEDGPGGSQKLYQPSKRGAIAALFDPSKSCVTATAEGPAALREGLVALGATPADYFEPDFVDSVGLCGVTGDPNCATGPAATWIERFRADRPAVDPKGPELLLWQGARDQLASPPLAQCAIDKIRSDLSAEGATARFTVCGDPSADHETVLSHNTNWVARWIASRTLGTKEPEDCAGVEALLPEDGGSLVCPELPGNSD